MAEIGRTNRTRGAGAVVYDITRAREKAQAAPPPAQPDSAGISESARELSRAHEAVQASPEVRTERVKALKHQIANGQYNPDPREVAKKILERGL